MFFTELKTDRLKLKSIDRSDREFIFSQFSDKVVTKYLFDEEPLENLEGADEIINFYIQPEPRNQHRWIIQRKSDGEKMGTCGFHFWNHEENTVEIGYDLKEKYWGNGYMQEALTEIIKFAKENMGVKKIIACIYIDNYKSIKLVTRFNFVMTGTRIEIFRGTEYLHNLYSLNFS